MSDTTDAVVTAIPSGFREETYTQWDAAIEAETDTVYPILGDPEFVDLEDDYSDDAEEVKSLPGATEAYHRKTRGKLARTMRLATEAFLDYLIYGTGNVSSGSASSAANEVQTVTQTSVSAGKFKIRDTLDGGLTAEINFDDDEATRQTKIEAIFGGAANVTVDYTSEVTTITFGGAYAAYNYPTLELVVTEAPVGGEFVLGQGTTGAAAGQYIQTVREPSNCTLNPHSFPYVEGLRCNGSTDAFKIYPGCVVNSLGFDVDSDDFLAMAYDLVTSGIELPGNTFSFPGSDSAMTRLLGNMVEVWLGDDFTSPFKIAIDELQKLSVKFNFNIVEPARINNLKTVSEYQYPKGGMTLDLSATFKGGKSSRFYQMIAACRAGYRPKMRILITPNSTPQRPLEFQFNKLKVAGAVKPNGREQVTELQLMALSNSTDQGRFTCLGTSAKSAYLQTA